MFITLTEVMGIRFKTFIIQFNVEDTFDTRSKWYKHGEDEHTERTVEVFLKEMSLVPGVRRRYIHAK